MRCETGPLTNLAILRRNENLLNAVAIAVLEILHPSLCSNYLYINIL